MLTNDWNVVIILS